MRLELDERPIAQKQPPSDERMICEPARARRSRASAFLRNAREERGQYNYVGQGGEGGVLSGIASGLGAWCVCMHSAQVHQWPGGIERGQRYILGQGLGLGGRGSAMQAVRLAGDGPPKTPRQYNVHRDASRKCYITMARYDNDGHGC